jgi:16S rRNA (adenine1518-N6/adenine1519-N6)-dimethyltransferase
LKTHHPRKRFGQHFLNDQAMIQRIVAAIAPHPEEHLVEIGPGQGALTLPVLRCAKTLDVIELDRDLIQPLAASAKPVGDLRIYEGDVLSYDFSQIKQDARPLRVIGNLPYNISTPLIFHLLNYTPCIKDMVFMLQKEVADRLAAEPDSDDYGRLSVMVQYACRVELLFDVPPQSFNPPPKVMSSIVRLVPHSPLPYVAHDEKLFAQIVREAFGQRRKTLRNSLKSLVTETGWQASGVRPDLRAENLSVQDFVKLSNTVKGD